MIDGAASRGAPVVSCLPTLSALDTVQLHGVVTTLEACVDVAEYKERRKRVATVLMSRLKKENVVGVVLVIYPCASVQSMQHDIQRVFRQDPDFLWLTGLDEPHALLACACSALGPVQWTLLLTESSRTEAWLHVPRTTCKAMEGRFLDGRVWPLTKETLTTLISECGSGADAPTVRFETEQNRAPPPALVRALRDAGVERLRAAPWWRQVVQQERVVKSPAELELLRRSAGASCAALLAVMRASVVAPHEERRRAGTEAGLAATFQYHVMMAGATRLAFPSIVAAGENATLLHYHRVRDVPQPGQLLLVDAGCEMRGYCSEVTRTWPVSGQFSAAQQMLYEAVLAINQSCVEACRAGARGGPVLTLRTLQSLALAQARRRLTGLRRALRATGARDEADEADEVSVEETVRCFPHGVAHFVGMDTHDTPLVGHDTPIPANAVLAVEPGLYFPRADADADADADAAGGGGGDPWHQLRGLGVRVEDMVVVGSPGAPPEVLTDGVPKRVEALLAVLCSTDAVRP